MNLISKMHTFIKRFSLKKNEDIELLQGIDVDNIYDDPQVSEEIRKTIKQNLNEINDIEFDAEELDKFLTHLYSVGDMPDEELRELEELAGKYSDNMLRKGVYEELIEGQDEDTLYLEKYTDEIEKAVERIAEFENKQSAVRHDMNILEGEKSELAYRKNRNVGAIAFTQVFLIFLVVIAAITALVLMVLGMFYNVNILVPGLIAVIIVIISMVWVSIFRRYLNYDIKRAHKLLNRAIELLNKTKIKYINNQALLDFEYNKYRVNSSEILRLRWENYNAHVENTKEFTSIESELVTLKAAVNRLLMRNRIDKTNEIMEYLDYLSNRELIEKIIVNKQEERFVITKRKQFLERQNSILMEILRDYES